MEKGYKIGLITDEEISQYREKVRLIEDGLRELRNHKVTKNVPDGPPKGTSLDQVLKQPEILYADLSDYDENFIPVSSQDAARQIEVQVKYEGYITRQTAQIRKVARLESMAIPPDLVYSSLKSLSREVRDRLESVRPANLGQASRIPGITPAAVSALMIYIKGRNNRASE
jgi:tRNA uridine 5-carboxymethylaminomethyl modification enzyme